MQIDKDTRGITMLGRSDGVLNPQGVRFGSAELYAVVEEIKDEYVDIAIEAPTQILTVDLQSR